jgi:predicted ATPase
MDMITNLTVRNYRCLADVTLQLGDLTVLVGPNSSGKTTLLDVFEFVKDALRDSLPTALDRRGGIQGVRRRSHGHPANVSVQMEFRDREDRIRGSYGFTITAEPGYAYSVRVEQCSVELTDQVRGIGKAAEFTRNSDRMSISVEGLNVKLDPKRLCLPVVAAYPHFALAYELLTSVSVYSVQPDKLREAQDPTEGKVLNGDGSNAPSVLREVIANNRGAYERLNEMLSRVAPGVSSPGTSHEGRKLALTFKVDVGAASPWEFEAFLMSDGTLRLLGILLALEQKSRLELLGIEEPEATIHPAALTTLFEAIAAASSRTQVVVTTHSPDVLNLVPILNIRCLRLVRGQTTISPAPPVALDAAMEGLMMPGDLMRANILEPDEGEVRSGQLSLEQV